MSKRHSLYEPLSEGSDPEHALHDPPMVPDSPGLVASRNPPDSLDDTLHVSKLEIEFAPEKVDLPSPPFPSSPQHSLPLTELAGRSGMGWEFSRLTSSRVSIPMDTANTPFPPATPGIDARGEPKDQAAFEQSEMKGRTDSESSVPRKHQCSICEKKYASKSSLDYHLGKHVTYADIVDSWLSGTLCLQWGRGRDRGRDKSQIRESKKAAKRVTEINRSKGRHRGEHRLEERRIRIHDLSAAIVRKYTRRRHT